MFKINQISILLMISLLFNILLSNFDDANYESISSNRYFFAIDYLFWKAEEDQLQYALKIPDGFPKDGIVFAREIFVKDQKFKGSSGFRFTGCYSFCNDWDIAVAWTHYNKRSSTSAFEPNRGILATTAFGLLDLGGLIGTDAKSKWTLRFDTIDFELANNWCFFDILELRSHYGLKFARINQLQNIDYTGITQNLMLNTKKRNNFWALGPRAGVDTNWYVWRGLSVVGNIAAALVYGKFNIHADYSVSQDPRLSPKFIEHKHRLRPTLQMLLGLNWQQIFCRAAIEIGVGYEAQFWWNQWQNIASPFALMSSVLPGGDLNLHGLTVRLALLF